MRLVAILTIVISAAFSVAAQNDIHAVDFRNFTYSAYCAGEEPEKITVKDGEYSKETQMEGYVDQVWFRVFSIKYGDLNSDNQFLPDDIAYQVFLGCIDMTGLPEYANLFKERENQLHHCSLHSF